jgi:iron(III) transport system substrate-binding protein
MRLRLACAFALALLFPLHAATNATAEDAGEVNVYSYRQPYLINPLFKDFTQETGIKVNVIFAEKGPIQSAALDAAIPPAYRAADKQWFGLTRRARVVYASKERVRLDKITYEDLADPKWRGKICIRSGQHVYNVALIASMIAAHGEEWTETWLKGVKANLARKPAGDDRLQVKGVYAGECDIAVGNTYYMGAMLKNDKEPEQKEWANSVTIIFPNTDDRGTHVNISGAVVAKYAPHKDNAVRLLEFLASDKGQEMYADVNNEYPVKEGIPWSPLVTSWGKFKPDPISLNEIAALRKNASELVDKVGFDDGPSS